MQQQWDKLLGRWEAGRFVGDEQTEQQFYDEDLCSSIYKDKMRPATDEEVLLLKEQIDIHGYHWNLDKMELEEKRKEDIRAAFPQSDYAQLQQDMNELSDRVKKLEERLFYIESKDMPLCGNSDQGV